MKKPTIIIITGTPGTGKSTLAKKLSLYKRWKIIRITDFVKKHGLVESYDSERKSQVIDQKLLVKRLQKEISLLSHLPGIIVEGHMSHFLPNTLVDLCIVTKTDISELNKRLKKRKYSNNKIQENLESEIFDVCLEEARDQHHNILILDTTHIKIKELVKRVEKILGDFKD